MYDSRTKEFINVTGGVFHFEHSLKAIAKWESKWHKAFFGKQEKTAEELMDYIRCMCLDDNPDPYAFRNLSREQMKMVEAYMNDPQTATYIWEPESKAPGKETVTNELMYYWMIALQIPFECEEWHVNHLLALIRVCNAKNDTGHKTKVNDADMRRRYAEINRQRREAMRSKG